jgi:anthranilate synthase/aminodeoxychorismate synthase-like glutamine amidotransferase
MRTLILDNYDSFSYNLYQLIGELDEAPHVVRNDRLTLDDVRRLEPQRIVISPGPGSPEDPAYFGICRAVIMELGGEVPILGVCLGLQGIVFAYGGRIVRAGEPMHGKTSVVHHHGDALFAGLPPSFEAMRYHSLVADPTRLPRALEVTARTADGVIMAVRHRSRPTVGVQFHPESVGTPLGRQILANFLAGG